MLVYETRYNVFFAPEPHETFSFARALLLAHISFRYNSSLETVIVPISFKPRAKQVIADLHFKWKEVDKDTFRRNVT